MLHNNSMLNLDIAQKNNNIYQSTISDPTTIINKNTNITKEKSPQISGMIDQYLIDLMPYDPSVKIFDNNLKHRILLMVQVIVNELIDSIKDFYMDKNLSLFDPHVGENLCQIRACQLLDIYFEAKNQPSIAIEMKHYENMATYIAKLLQEKIHESVAGPRLTVQSFLDEFQLNISIPPTLYYLTLSHFLTKFVTFNEQENTIINYDKLLCNLKVSKNIGRRIIHQYQIQLSYHSYRYVETKALEQKKNNINLLKSLQKFDDDGRHTLPCYLVMDVLLGNLKGRKNNLLFVVRYEKKREKKLTVLFYVYNETAGCYFFCSNHTEEMLNEPCFIVHGICDASFESIDSYIAKFNDIGVEHVIMANMATHPQYSGKKLTALKQNPFIPIITSENQDCLSEAIPIENQFKLMKQMGEEIGCSAANPKLLHIRHIFCDRLDRELQRARDQYFYSTKQITLEKV
ncbi:MAG: hypothetical protein H0U27_10155 [Nitrosopumilus sp.]|nr:hypothetical protein [Nitrosopumilus sp.]